MRARRFSVVALGGFVLVLWGGGCGGGSGQPDGGNSPHCTIAGVSLTGSAATVNPGETVNLTATVTQAAGSAGCNGGVVWAVSPVITSALTVSGLTATFATGVPDMYTIYATSKDDTSKAGSFQVTVRSQSTCGTANGTTVVHSADITADETWAGNGTTHSIPNSIKIRAPATVTIQPCALVAVAPSAEIGVLGDTTGNRPARLFAAGTDDQTAFIVFGPATQGQPWGFIHGYNVQSLVDLEHTALVQAGGAGNFTHYSAIAMVGPGLNSQPAAVLKTDHLVIDHPIGGGIYLDSQAAFTSDSGWVGVVGAQDRPLAFQLMAAGSVPQVILQDDANQTQHFEDAYVISTYANVNWDTTITGNIPLYLETGFNVIPSASNTNPLGVTLTVQSGAEVRFKAGANLRVIFGGTGNPGSNPIGRLVAVGTATAPIRFTSAATAPAAGDWAGLQMPTATGSQLAFVIVEYAGGTSGVVSANCRPTGSADNAALIIGGTDFVPPGSMIVSSVIQFSAGHGIDATWANPTVSDPNLASNGNVFTDIAGCQQTYNGLTVGSCPAGGGCTQ